MSSDPSFNAASGGPRYHVTGAWTRYSSWTARVQVFLDYYSIPYESQYLNLSLDSKTEIMKYTPSGLVPVLVDRKHDPPLRINDSLAILLHLSEEHSSIPFFPIDPYLRAIAISAAAEMHSGFSALRNEFSASYVAKYTGNIPISAAAKRDVDRVLEIWGNARRKTIENAGEEGSKVKDDGFLCGEFGVVDAFFWPVLWRFRSYNLPLTSATPEAIEWMGKMWTDPKLREIGKEYFHQATALDAQTRVEHYEDVFRGLEGVACGRFQEDWVFHS